MSEAKKDVKEMLVKGSSPVRELAGSIMKVYEGGERNIELRAIGAGSVNQMYKALATARALFAQKGLDLSIRPGFDETDIDNSPTENSKRTVMVARLIIQ